MATRAAALRSRDLDRAFFTAVALALLASTFAGFAPTYFLRGLSGAAPLSPLVIVHGAANSAWIVRSEEHTSGLQSLMRISYAVFCLKKNKHHTAIIS